VADAGKLGAAGMANIVKQNRRPNGLVGAGLTRVVVGCAIAHNVASIQGHFSGRSPYCKKRRTV
jgi:hypothetical protein